LLFGNISDGKMQLNNAGKMIKKWWHELKNKFHNIELNEFVVMPNHIHGIIQIVNQNVGTDLRVCPDNTNTVQSHDAGQSHRIPPTNSLFTMVQWFKTMTTNEYIRDVKQNGWQPFNRKLWQRNYWEHIIRDEESYYKIAEYILNNPLKWQDDKYYA